MTLQTRTPTGRPAWPMILLAGVEKAGKSWAAAEASASPLIGATYWISCGEDDPDELGRIGRFLIVEHDGSYNAIVTAIREINALEQTDAKPTLLVLDSVSMVWSMITDEMQVIANRRAATKAERSGKKAPTDDVQISMDLWNKAAGRWRRLMDALKAHRGPVLLTARLAQVTIMANGEPTAEKDRKIEGHKTLPYDATVIVQLRSRADRYLTGVRSVTWQTEPDALLPFPAGRTVADVWELLGLEDAADRVHHAPDGAASMAVEDQVRADLLQRLRAVSRDWDAIASWWEAKHAEPITEASDLAALLELTEGGERIHAEGRARVEAERVAAEARKPQPLPLDEPPAPAPPEQPAPEAPAQPQQKLSVSEARVRSMRTRLAQQFDRLTITHRDERLYYLGLIVGREITTSKELNDDELRAALQRLDRSRDRDDFETTLTEGTTAHA